MLKIEFHDRDAGGDPPPRFAADAEIELAEKLRNQLERRYLAPSGANAPHPSTASERH